ncbi:MAG TPA: hypothetical protein VNO82_22535 [Solirubrobacteraceae bacterium]|nr:hypothetical protein [Solirubrobacteraceae bacterium]
MSAALRAGLFVAGLAVAFGAAFLAGTAIDPDAGDDATGAHADATAHGADAQRAHSADSAARPARLVLDDPGFEPGAAETLRFRVVDAQGRTVRDFDVAHRRAMHAIAVRRDLTGYRHVHPRPTRDGGWAVEIAFPEAGPQRVFADFVSRGEPHTLSADLDVAGRYAPRPLPAPATTTADAGDGYAVDVAAVGSERRFTVTRDGIPVDDVEPYLGARGHLVALREGDLAFQHVHPRDRATEGREIRFDVALPGSRRHRLFLQFKHDGKVRTAAFTEPAGAPTRSHGEDGHGH